MLLAGACAPPNQVANNIVLQSPTPSPSPTLTTAFAASGPGFHAGEVGVAYAAVAQATGGGVQPYHWSVATGALPPGLNLGDDGSVSGSPTAAGNFAFTIQVTDSGDGVASIAGMIKIAPHLSAALLPGCAQYCNVELGCSNACGAFGSYSGGIAPYTFTVIRGPLPAGTSLSPIALTLNGTFGGQTGYLQIRVKVGDAFGATATVSPTFWMYPHIALSGGNCLGNYITGCTAKLQMSGGTPTAGAPTVKIGNVVCPANQGCNGPAGPGPLPNTLPKGFSAVVSGGYVIVTFPNRLTDGWAGSLQITFVNNDVCSSGPTMCSSVPATVLVNVIAG